jgi:serine/threonine protein kinase/sugar lactone lactonase YvrE
MASAPASSLDLLDLVRKSGLVEDQTLDDWVRGNPDLPAEVKELAARLVADGLVTKFHARHMLTGKYRGFILGQYKVLEQIGAGGMGVVFLAEHRTMKRRAALKVLPGDRANDPESLERFYREARLVAALDHPNIVRAFDADQSGGIHFMAMEYVEGESLEQLVRRKGPLPAAEAADYVAQAACGLQHAHERGLVHRDVKPGNLLLEKGGTVKVLDLGLARLFADRSNLTRDLGGVAIGTADYMAPEQALDSHDVDIRADVYSLGVTFYTLLTGKPPFAAESVTQKLLAHHMREPEPLAKVRPDLPAELAGVVARMMAKRPEDRYQEPAEVVEALEPWATARFVPASATQRIATTRVNLPHRKAKKEPEPPAPKRRPKWVVPAAAGALLGVVGIVVLLCVGGDRKPAAPANTAEEPSVAAAREDKKPGASAPKVPVAPKVGEVRRFDTKNEQVERLALSPNGALLAGSSRQGVVRVWELATGRLVHELRGHKETVWFVAFSADGKQLASAGQDGTARVWDVAGGRETKTISGPQGAVWSAAFSPDGRLLLTGGEDGVARIWNAGTGALVRACDRHALTINWVAWSPDGSLVYSAGWDGVVRACFADTGLQKFSCTLEKRFSTLAVSRDGALLLCAGDSPQLHLLNAKTGEPIRTLADPMKALIAPWSVGFSDDGRRAVSTGGELMIRVWDVTTGKVLYHLGGHSENVPGCVMTPDGRHIVTTSMDRTVRLWSVP